MNALRAKRYLLTPWRSVVSTVLRAESLLANGPTAQAGRTFTRSPCLGRRELIVEPLG